jgi:hypothetical protein
MKRMLMEIYLPSIPQTLNPWYNCIRKTKLEELRPWINEQRKMVAFSNLKVSTIKESEICTSYGPFHPKEIRCPPKPKRI